jgi:hypothetical protein
MMSIVLRIGNRKHSHVRYKPFCPNTRSTVWSPRFQEHSGSKAAYSGHELDEDHAAYGKAPTISSLLDEIKRLNWMIK